MKSDAMTDDKKFPKTIPGEQKIKGLVPVDFTGKENQQNGCQRKSAHFGGGGISGLLSRKTKPIADALNKNRLHDETHGPNRASEQDARYQTSDGIGIKSPFQTMMSFKPSLSA